MSGRRIARLLIEAAFLAGLAALAGVARMRPDAVAGVMAFGWVVVALAEWASWLDRPHFGRGLPPRYYVPQVSLPPPLPQGEPVRPRPRRPADADEPQTMIAPPPRSPAAAEEPETMIAAPQRWAPSLDEWPVIDVDQLGEETLVPAAADPAAADPAEDTFVAAPPQAGEDTMLADAFPAGEETELALGLPPSAGEPVPEPRQPSLEPEEAAAPEARQEPSPSLRRPPPRPRRRRCCSPATTSTPSRPPVLPARAGAGAGVSARAWWASRTGLRPTGPRRPRSPSGSGRGEAQRAAPAPARAGRTRRARRARRAGRCTRCATRPPRCRRRSAPTARSRRPRAACRHARGGCPVRLTAATEGVVSPVLPCGERLYLHYRGRRRCSRASSAHVPQSRGSEFGLTAALAHRLGVSGLRRIAWSYAAAA